MQDRQCFCNYLSEGQRFDSLLDVMGHALPFVLFRVFRVFRGSFFCSLKNYPQNTRKIRKLPKLDFLRGANLIARNRRERERKLFLNLAVRRVYSCCVINFVVLARLVPNAILQPTRDVTTENASDCLRHRAPLARDPHPLRPLVVHLYIGRS